MWIPTYRKFKETLTAMCRMTSPHGCESYVWPHLPSPPYGGAPNANQVYKHGTTNVDEHGNYIVCIPGTGDRIMWTAHCDTADSHPTLVNMKWTGDMLHTDGKTILGADDKVGCAIMAMMIRAGCPGTYVFFQGEEVGCVGSSAMAEDTKLLDYDCCISLDRRGYDSVITHQRGRRTCSDTWASELGALISDASQGIIKMRPDPTGVYTDSVEFSDLVPECTNLSVGYFNQHSNNEKTNVAFSYLLCCSLIRIVSSGLIPSPKRDIVTLSMENDDYDDYRYMMKYDWTHKRKTIRDYDAMSEQEWLDWKDAI